jgi:hypothetical protein
MSKKLAVAKPDTELRELLKPGITSATSEPVRIKTVLGWIAELAPMCVPSRKTSALIVTVFLLISITLWHVFCSLGVIWVGLGYLVLVIPIVLMPPFVLVRRVVRKSWTGLDVLLTWVAVLPGLVFAFAEVSSPHSPNVGWLTPVIIAYLLAPVLVQFFWRLDQRGAMNKEQNKARQSNPYQPPSFDDLP